MSEKLLTIISFPIKIPIKIRRTQVAEMFDRIAPKYDFMNHFFRPELMWVGAKKRLKD
jgi:ubiquinone/menaquinone biosynthesis C-methylase UbiE